MAPLPQRAVVPPVMDCAGLARQDFTDIAEAPTNISSAAVEPAKGDRAEFCVVKGIIAPQIQFELRLPTKTYTGRYLQGGCGGTCGMILNEFTPACDQKPAFGGGFAVAFENSGHVGANMIDTLWALKAPALRRDFAERAAHVMAVVAKEMIARYYGKAPAHSYFQGCSDGGREGLKEAQNYPEDFDGIVVGAPAYWITQMPLRIIWESQHGLDAENKPILTKESLELLHRSVLDACDGLDGLKDGQIDDSRACHFDPATLVCKAGQATNCITQRQAVVMQAYYSGPVDAEGHQLYLGGEPYGSELTWLQAFSLMGSTLGAQQMKFMTYDGNLPPDFNWRTWKPDAAALADMFKHGGYYNANDPDLRAFRDAGGKLIIWQGAADNAAGPYGMFDYYQRVRDTLGGFRGTQPFMRVFLVPGVYHCRGGYVPYEEDYLGAMVNWVEKDKAPDSILASAVLSDGTIRERPLYAYPVHAKYKGSGDINRAENFLPARPAKEPSDRYDWLGADMK
jgi:feruloyl esterase